MAKTNFRRSISVTAETYARLSQLAASERRSASGIIEDLIAARCDAAGVAAIPRDVARASHPQSRKLVRAAAEQSSTAPHGGGHFTF